MTKHSQIKTGHHTARINFDREKDRKVQNFPLIEHLSIKNWFCFRPFHCRIGSMFFCNDSAYFVVYENIIIINMNILRDPVWNNSIKLMSDMKCFHRTALPCTVLLYHAAIPSAIHWNSLQPSKYQMPESRAIQ